MTTTTTDGYAVAALTPQTWDAFEAMVERHHGVFGGCWCTWFHTMHGDKVRTYEGNRDLKSQLVEEGRAHASLVLDGDTVVAWCQFGSPEELPNIRHRKEYLETADLVPDYRVTCLFVDKGYRRRGLSAIALQGVLDLVAEAGGGVVEGYPHVVTPGKRQSVLYSGTQALFERAGFEHVRSKGTKNCVMRRFVG